MKMLPNAQGTTVSLQTGELKRLEFTQDLSSTHVEEMSDLEVAIWVQNYSTKEVLNDSKASTHSSSFQFSSIIFPFLSLNCNCKAVFCRPAPKHLSRLFYCNINSYYSSRKH